MRQHILVKGAVLITLLLVVVSCGSNQQESPLEDYILQLEKIRHKSSDAMVPVLTHLNTQLESASSFESIQEVIRDFIDGSMPLVEAELNSLSKLKPVPETQASHEAYVGFDQELLDVSNLVLKEVDRVSSTSELQGLLSKLFSYGADLDLQAEEACFDLQDVAGRNGIQVDLRC